MFKRTDLGLSNEHLFHRVDIVGYCEGVSPLDEGASLDEAFWTKIFSLNGVMVKFKSTGNKSDLLKIALKIKNDEISNVIVGMDRDYDDLLGTYVSCDNVFYTYGYSWENDVILDINIDHIFAAFATTLKSDTVRLEFSDYFKSQSVNFRRAFAIDFKYFLHTSKLFDRSKPLSVIESGGSHPPRLKKGMILKKAKELGKFQSAHLPPEQYIDVCGLKRFFGKSVSYLIYHWMCFRSRGMADKRSIPYRAFMSMAISQLGTTGRPSEMLSYYADAITEA